MIRYGLLLLLAAGLTACASSPAPIYVTLESPQPMPADRPGLRAVRVGPVNLPELHDRAQLMVHTSAHRVEPAAGLRWAQPYRHELARALAARLAVATGNPRVLAASVNVPAEAYLRLAVDVVGIEARAGDALVMDVVWTLRESTGGAVLASRRSLLRVAMATMDGPDGEALAAAHGRAIAELAREIAPALK